MYGLLSDFEKEKELDMIYELDSAAANYIGEGQLKGDKNSSYLLYNLAEKIAPEFNQDTGGISQVNKKILDLRNEMTIPLVQKFIWHMFITKDSDFVELYALSILPWIKVYDPSVYEYILGKVVFDNFLFETADNIPASIVSARLVCLVLIITCIICCFYNLLF